MTDKRIKALVHLETIKEALVKNRQPFDYEGTSVTKRPTLAEWAIEETVCALLELLESDDNANT